jgi:hypothetical protein
VAVRSLLENGKLPKQPKPKRTPSEVCLAAWCKVPGEDRPEVVIALVNDKAFAAVLKEVGTRKAEPDDEEYRGEEE